MNLITYDGIMGAGKTLGMSLQAYDWAQRSGCTLYSNYGLVGSKPFTRLSDFEDVALQPSSIICLDECHMDLSSRDYNTNSVKYFTNIVFYLRKLRCTLMLTTPLFRNIDSRVRDVDNIHVQVSKNATHFIYDYFDVQTDNYLKQKRMRQDIAKQMASHIFDTNSMVTPLEYPSKKEEFNTLLENIKIKNSLYLEAKAEAV